MIVGVISDTHGLLRPSVEAALDGCEHIVHAGDVGDPAVLERLGRIAPITAVRGNVDTEPWARSLPETAEITLGGARILVLHNLRELAPNPGERGIAVVISGHTHQPRMEYNQGVLYLNPGSAGPRRFRLPISLALLHLDGARPSAELITLSE